MKKRSYFISVMIFVCFVCFLEGCKTFMAKNVNVGFAMVTVVEESDHEGSETVFEVKECTHELGDDRVCPLCGTVVVACVDSGEDGQKYFATLEKALISAKNGDIVKLLADAYGEKTLQIPVGVTFDGMDFEVQGGIPNGAAIIENYGIISGGFFGYTEVCNFGTIIGGTHNGKISNSGEINGGEFINETHELNNDGVISGGTFNSKQVLNNNEIKGGTFQCVVTTNNGISGGTFKDSVNVTDGEILGGTFNGDVNNGGTISGGSFTGVVSNFNNISGGEFSNAIKVCNGTAITNLTNSIIIGSVELINESKSDLILGERLSLPKDFELTLNDSVVSVVHTGQSANIALHVHGYSIRNSNEECHWWECVCGEVEQNSEEAHSDENFNHKCDVCERVLSTCQDDDTNHECDVCGTQMGEHKASEGTHVCNYCNEVVSECEDDDGDCICNVCGQEMEHTFSNEWSCDDKKHWRECECGKKEQEGQHEYNEWQEGETIRRCIVCQRAQSKPQTGDSSESTSSKESSAIGNSASDVNSNKPKKAVPLWAVCVVCVVATVTVVLIVAKKKRK